MMIQNLGTAARQASESLLFKLIPYIAVALFLVGAGFALCLKKNNPTQYGTIGRVALATDGHSPVVDEEDPQMPEVDLDLVRELEKGQKL